MALMHYNLGWRGSYLLLGVWLFSSAALVVADEKLDQTQERLGQVRERIEQVKKTLVSDKKRRQVLTQELKTTEQEIGQLTRRLRDLNQQLQGHKRRLSSLSEQREEAQQELSEQRVALIEQVRAAYALGRQERIKILLNQQDPATVSRVMAYYDYFNRARARQLKAINETLGRLHRVEYVIIEEEARLAELYAQKEQEKEDLELGLESREVVLTALSEEIRGKGEELAGLKEDEGRLKKLLEELESNKTSAVITELAERKPFHVQKGEMPWPSKGHIGVRFGEGKVEGFQWDGVVIRASEGSTVRAVHHGRVVFSDWLRGFGLLLIIDHGNGYMSLYGYNQGLFKDTGEWVEAGEPIAQVGRSGGQSEPGIYFGVRYNGRPLNPAKWCVPARGNRIGFKSSVVLPQHGRNKRSIV